MNDSGCSGDPGRPASVLTLNRMGILSLYRTLSIGAAALLLPAVLVGQSAGDLRKAANLITPAKTYDRLAAIAHDSMGGRDTPSPELDRLADHLAATYARWGLKPAGENGSYIQRYPLVRRRLNQEATVVEVVGTDITIRMGDWAYAAGMPPAEPVNATGVILGGNLTPEAIAAVDLRGKVAIIVYDITKAVQWRTWINAIAQQGPAAVLTIRNDPPAQFAAARSRVAGAPRWELDTPVPTGGLINVVIHDSTFAGRQEGADMPDWTAIRTSTAPVISPTPAGISIRLSSSMEIVERATAPNVVAMIEGSDRQLKNEYVIFSAHMDHVGRVGVGYNRGCSIRGTDAPSDSICNGADDNGSGTTALMGIAEAFSSLKKKPKRSVIILHVSAEELGLFGSEWYSEHPTVPAEQIVANVNMDMVGRNSPDSIVVIGKEHSNLGATLNLIGQRHPELKLIPSDDIWPQERFYERSDHFNFARIGIPVLFFFAGVHEQYHRTSDHVELMDVDKISRVAKLGFYLAAEVANAPARPVWDPASYETYVQKK